MAEGYTVKLEVFEGPLDLLLQLIEKRKLHISEISLARVTDDYLSYVKELEAFPLREAAHFILIASTLVLIKSRALLPVFSLSDEEEATIEELEKRLAMYKRIKELGGYIEERFGRSIIRYREPTCDITPVFSPTKEISIGTILETIQEFLRALPTKEMIPQIVVAKIMSLEEMIENLEKRLNKALKMSFKELTSTVAHKKEIVVTFLAMLELIRRGIITVTQERHLEDIHLEKQLPSDG